MLLNEILDNNERRSARMLRRLISKKRLNNRDKAKATKVMSRLKAKRHNPLPGDTPLEKSGHFHDPFGGMSGYESPASAVGTQGHGVTRY